jgi:hypothetical protein
VADNEKSRPAATLRAAVADDVMVTTVADAAELLRLEYAETPDLVLTTRQAQGLCDLSRELCESALEILQETGYLKRTAGGSYLRREPVGPPDVAAVVDAVTTTVIGMPHDERK